MTLLEIDAEKLFWMLQVNCKNSLITVYHISTIWKHSKGRIHHLSIISVVDPAKSIKSHGKWIFLWYLAQGFAKTCTRIYVAETIENKASTSNFVSFLFYFFFVIEHVYFSDQ